MRTDTEGRSGYCGGCRAPTRHAGFSHQEWASRPSVMTKPVTRSTEEAMRVLEQAKGPIIIAARRVAQQLAHAHGDVHTRQVRQALIEQGLLTQDLARKDFWMGAVFRGSEWEWTGRWHTYTDAERNIHERTVKVWRLR